LNRKLQLVFAVIIEQKHELMSQIPGRFAFFKGLLHKVLGRRDQVRQSLEGCGIPRFAPEFE
jgi:hypothetical protein